MGKYKEELVKAMNWLGSKSDIVFIGQAVVDKGTAISDTLLNIPPEKKIELPVTEALQMGLSIGMTLNGSKVVSIYPRFDFLILATNELVNHLNRLKKYSNNEYEPSVIIRTSIGSVKPLHPNFQHCNNYSDAFRLMCDNIDVIELIEAESIFPAYENAYNRTDGRSTILVEFADFLNET